MTLPFAMLLFLFQCQVMKCQWQCSRSTYSFFLENQLCNEHGYKYLSLVYENDFLTHQTLDFMCWSWSLCFFSPQLVAFITYSLTIPLTRTVRGQFYFQKRKKEKKSTFCFAIFALRKRIHVIRTVDLTDQHLEHNTLRNSCIMWHISSSQIKREHYEW